MFGDGGRKHFGSVFKKRRKKTPQGAGVVIVGRKEGIQTKLRKKRKKGLGLNPHPPGVRCW